MIRRVLPMNLFGFLLKINFNAYKASPVQGAMGIFVAIAQRISTIVTFLLPLKVILLAASPSVPRYFAGFITDANREIWIASLAGGTIVFFLISLALDEKMRKLVDDFSADILKGTIIVHKRADEREKASQNCQLLIQANGAVIFAVIALAAIFWLDPTLGLVTIILIGIIFLANSLLLGTSIGQPFKRLRDFITGNLKRYVQFNSFALFIVGFFMILMPFLLGEGGNALVALITFIVLRQALSGIETAVVNYDALFSQRNQLRFLTKSEQSVDLFGQGQTDAPFERFTKAERNEWVLQSLATIDTEAKPLSCTWVDPASPHERDFDVTMQGISSVRSYRMRITLRGSRHVLANQDLLAQFDGNDASFSPPIISRFALGENTCVVYDTDGLQRLDPDERPRIESEFLFDCWSHLPPKKLVGAYRRYHTDLAERFTEKIIAELQAVADDEEEQTLVIRLGKALPAIRDHLARAPCYIHFEPRGVDWLRVGADGRGRTLYPGHWRIEPIGALLPKRLSSDALLAAVERVRQRREDIREPWGANDIHLVNACSRLNRLFPNKKFKECLKTVATLLPLLHPSGETDPTISSD